MVIYFAPETKAPVSLMELGMWGAAKGANMVVCCPEEFWKSGYVEMASRSLGVRFCVELRELEGVVRGAMEGLVNGVTGGEV